MKQIYILYVFIIGLATACGNKMVKGNEEAAKDSDFMLDGPSMEYHPTEHDIKMNELAVQEIAVVNQVTEIYEAVNKAYNSKNWQQETAKLDKTYCSKDWNATVAAVRDKDKGTDDIGFFDADYWGMGQDWSEDIHASDIKLKDIDLEVDPWLATVTLKLHNCGAVTDVTVSLVHEDEKWKVDELDDWKASMKEYLAE